MLEPVGRETLAQRVLVRLQEHIASSNLMPGDRLPSEIELTETLDVSRATVREALKSLELVGIVSRRPKRGCVLQAMDMGALAQVMQPSLVRSASDLKDLFVARRQLELSILPLIIENATTDDYIRFEKANQQIEADIEGHRVPTDADINFHEALFESTKNKVMIQLGALVREFFRAEAIRDSVNQLIDTSPRPGRIATLQEHRQIVESLRTGDLVDAHRLMEKHLNTYLGTVLEKDRGANAVPA